VPNDTGPSNAPVRISRELRLAVSRLTVSPGGSASYTIALSTTPLQENRQVLAKLLGLEGGSNPPTGDRLRPLLGHWPSVPVEGEQWCWREQQRHDRPVPLWPLWAYAPPRRLGSGHGRILIDGGTAGFSLSPSRSYGLVIPGA